MLKNRLACIVALLGATAFFIFYRGYLSYFLFLFLVSILLLSYLLSRPGVRNLQAALHLNTSQIQRGQAFTCYLKIANASRFPAACMTMEIDVKNLLSGESSRQTIRLTAIRHRQTCKLSFTAAHCGLVHIQLTRIRAYDYLGLFARTQLDPPVLSVLVLPHPAILAESVEWEDGVAFRPSSALQTSTGPSGIYDVREYRAGDALNSIHWKLSAKTERTMVREQLQNMGSCIILSLDFFGDMQTLDNVWDHVGAFADALLSRQQPFFIEWLHPIKQALTYSPISAREDLFSFYQTIFSLPLPTQGTSLLEMHGNDQNQHRFYARPDGILHPTSAQLIPGVKQ